MLQELKDFLSSTAPGETMHLISDTIDLLDLYNYNDYNQYITEILMTIDDRDNLQVLEDIVESFRTMVFAVLSEHSIFLVEDTPLFEAIKILSGLHALENSEEIDFIHNTLNSEHDDEETLAILIANHSTISIENCMMYFETVTPSIIRAIKELYDNKVEFKPVSLIDEQKEKNLKINKLKKLVEGTDSFIAKLIRSGVKIDMKFESYVNTYKSDIDGMEYKEIAHALLGFMIMSIDRCFETVEFLNEYVSANYSSLNDFTKISSELKLLYSKANAF